MGGWSFVEPRLRALGCAVEYVGRDASASPATGSHHVHVREQKELVEAALAQGHDVTLFNRGQTNSDLFPQAERRYGDRLRQISDGTRYLLGLLPTGFGPVGRGTDEHRVSLFWSIRRDRFPRGARRGLRIVRRSRYKRRGDDCESRAACVRD